MVWGMSQHTSHDDMAWAGFGSCVGVDPDIFFPERGDDTSRARAVCRVCPVRDECLSWALESRQCFGIWGGMTPSQRRRLRRHPKLVLVPANDDPDATEPDMTRPHGHLTLVPARP